MADLQQQVVGKSLYKSSAEDRKTAKSAKKMRAIPAIVLFAVLALAARDRYTTQYDNVDLDEILNNDRLYKRYFDCLANKGKCTPDAKSLKEVIPDALRDGCAKCNGKQQKAVEKVLKFIMEKKKGDFDALAKIYDSEGSYRKKYKKEAEKRGLQL